MLMIFVETRFHLSLTVMFWFKEKYSCVKSSRDFWMLRWSALFLMKNFRLGRCLRLGEIFTSMIIVLWSAMPSTTFSFFINPGLFVKTRSRILLAFPCLRVGTMLIGVDNILNKITKFVLVYICYMFIILCYVFLFTNLSYMELYKLCINVLN